MTSETPMTPPIIYSQSPSINEVFQEKLKILENKRKDDVLNAKKIANKKMKHKTIYWYKLHRLVEQINVYKTRVSTNGSEGSNCRKQLQTPTQVHSVNRKVISSKTK